MDKSAFEGLVGFKLSVATSKQKQDGTPESYIGYLERVGKDYIVLDYGKASTVPTNAISKVILSLSEIRGIWVYADD